jgi:Ca2+-binding EF-hand superfamily protein
MKRDVNLWDKDHGQPPDINELAEIFEFLDEDHTGMISANDLM